MAITESIYDASRTSESSVKTWLGGDEHENAEPVHDAIRDIDAVQFNKLVKGLAEVAARTRKGNLVCYSFSIANATASLTDSVLARFSGGDAAWTEALAPWGGSVVAIAMRTENARSAGSATATWTKNGTKQTLNAAIDGTNTQSVRSQQLSGVETLSKLDRIGVKLTTSSDWAAGTTPSLWVDVLVSYGAEESI